MHLRLSVLQTRYDKKFEGACIEVEQEQGLKRLDFRCVREHLPLPSE